MSEKEEGREEKGGGVLYPHAHNPNTQHIHESNNTRPHN